MTNDTQSNKFIFVINNPNEKGLTHQIIAERLIRNFKTFEYMAVEDEVGEKGTPHFQGFVYFGSRVRFSSLKKQLPEAHIEKAKGTVCQNIEYVSKTGKWAGTKKAQTSVEKSFEEFGKRPPDSKGKRDDMAELYQMIANDMTNAEIIAENNDYILQIDKLEKVRTIILTERYKETVRLDLEVVYISGATGTGKTRYVYESNGYSNVYRVTDYQHPFDGYACQRAICFDEFRNSLKLKEMLLYCDIYPIELPSRYANKFACYEKIYIVSNWELEEQYTDLQRNDKESWAAFLRRISKVIIFDKSGNRTEYDSVEKYLSRDAGFKACIDEDNPFQNDKKR